MLAHTAMATSRQATHGRLPVVMRYPNVSVSSALAPGGIQASTAGAAAGRSATNPAARQRRVLLIEAAEDGTVGGSHRALADLAAVLPEHGYTPVVLSYTASRVTEEISSTGIEVYIWRPPIRSRSRPGRVLQFWSNFIACWRMLRRLRVEIVHLNNSLAVGYDDWLPASKVAGIPIVIHQRMDYRPSARRPLWRWAIRRFDRVIAISEHVHAGLRKLGLPESRLVRVYDGIDARRFVAKVQRSPSIVRDSLGVSATDTLVVMVGHLRPWKGQEVVLREVAQLPEQARRNLRLVIVGSAGLENAAFEQSLRALVATHDLGGIVSFLGERSDVPDLMNAADVVLHASTIPEPFGLVVLEGLALGKLVIASALGGPAEVLADGSGLLFDPAAPGELRAILERISAMESTGEAVLERARKRVEAFAIARVGAEVRSVYQSLVGG